MDKLVCVQDFEMEAFKILGQNALNYYKSGADDEITLRDNKRVFKRWIIRPRMLRDISVRDLSIKVLGKSVAFPVGISPTALQKLAHEDGELAMARAAGSMNTIYILSTTSTSSIEEVAQANPNGRKWFQLYVHKDLSKSIDMIRRAEKAEFEAIVITVDATFLGKRRIVRRDKFHLPKHLRLAHYDPNRLDVPVLSKLGDHLKITLNWKDIEWFKNIKKLPIILKGIMTAEDAKIGVELGVAGIFVSNHGGRQVDTVSASIDALPEVVNEVKGQCDIYCEDGVSTGTDVFKALALGATMVFAGRPFIWGLVENKGLNVCSKF